MPYGKFSINFNICLIHRIKFQRFQEFGFAKFWYGAVYRDKEWYRTFFEDYPKESHERKPLNLASVRGAILILLVSNILSFFVFVGEKVWK